MKCPTPILCYAMTMCYARLYFIAQRQFKKSPTTTYHLSMRSMLGDQGHYFTNK